MTISKNNNLAYKIKGIGIWLICACFFLYEFMLRTVVGTYQIPLMEDLSLSNFQFSLISATVFAIMYGSMQIPAGIIIDQYGLKKALAAGSLTCAIATFGFAKSYDFYSATFFRLLMGFGASFGFICLLIAVNEWLPKKNVGLFIGLSQFIGTIGPMGAAGPLNDLSASGEVGWRMVFYCLSVGGFVIFILGLLFVRNNNEVTGNYTVLYRPESAKKSFKRLFARSQPWFIAFVSAGLYFTVEFLSESEGKSFLIYKDIDGSVAAYMITLSWLGYAIGCPLLGMISDFVQKRKPLIYYAAILGLISIIAIIYATNIILLKIAFFCLGFSASGQSIAYATISEQYKKQYVALGFSLCNATVMVLSAINAPLIGYLVDHYKEHGNLTLELYQNIFGIFVSISILTIIIAKFFIKETFCKSLVDYTYIEYK